MCILTVVITKQASSVPLHASWVVFLITDLISQSVMPFCIHVMHSDRFFYSQNSVLQEIPSQSGFECST